MPDAFVMEAIRLKLQKMFRPGSYFSICDVEECLRSAGIDPPRQELQALRPLHCVNWSDMTPEMRQEVFRRTMALFSHPEMDFSDLEAPLIGGSAQGSAGLFRKLLGGSADA